MSTAPTAVFLDTSIFDGQQYNFESRKFTDFIKLCKEMRLELLLPHPTELEIHRHIKERSFLAVKAIRDAIAKAPFLRKWKGFPEERFIADVSSARKMLGAAAGAEYQRFLKNFAVIHLDYSGIDVASIMSDYDRCLPPFAEGKKRKEFPDAFAIAMLAHHATTQDKQIAVISSDGDFESACENHARLLYFDSLEEATSNLLRDKNPERVLRFASAIEKALDAFNASFTEALRRNLNYLHYQGLTVEASVAEAVRMSGFKVIAVGKDECTVAFEASVDAEHKVSWPDPQSPFQRTIGHIKESSGVYGTAKVAFTPISRIVDRRKTWGLEYKSVGAIEFDNYGSVALTSLPPNYEPPPGLLGSLASLLNPANLQSSETTGTGALTMNPYIGITKP